MNSELIKSLTWAIVELEAGRPQMGDIRAALNLALAHAAGLELKHDVRTNHLANLARIWGGD